MKGRRRRKTQGRGAGGREKRWQGGQEGKEAGKVEERRRKREGNKRATKM